MKKTQKALYTRYGRYGLGTDVSSAYVNFSTGLKGFYNWGKRTISNDQIVVCLHVNNDVIMLKKSNIKSITLTPPDICIRHNSKGVPSYIVFHGSRKAWRVLRAAKYPIRKK